jgi:hypothetical protein
MRGLIFVVTAGCYVSGGAGSSGYSTTTTSSSSSSSTQGQVALVAELEVLPPITTDNSRAVLVARSVSVRASSEYGGWPATNAVDGDPQTSWYSGMGDAAANGKSPFIEVVLDRPSPVRRVTVLGNRDPAYLKGYTVFRGQLDILDANGRVLLSQPSEGLGNRRDFDFHLDPPVNGASAVRFTSLADEGDKNQYGDIAIAEVEVD